MGVKGQIDLNHIQQFLFAPIVKFEKDASVSEVGQRSYQIQAECTTPIEAKIKHEIGIDAPEVINKTEHVDIKPDNDSDSFQKPFVEDSLQISAITSETIPKKSMEQHVRTHNSVPYVALRDL